MTATTIHTVRSDVRGNIVSTIYQREATHMTSKGGNQAWRDLRDDVNAKGEPLPADPNDWLDELWAGLSVQQQQLVATGRITLESLIERITAAVDADLCPRCGCDVISPAYPGFGLCLRCVRSEMNAAFEQTLAEIDAQREADRLKQQVHRARIDAGLPTPRGGTSR